MARTRRHDEPQELPRREQLEALAHAYYHLRNEHQSAGAESGIRRRIEDRMLDVRDRFQRLLQEFVPEEERRAWLEHLEWRKPAPEGPPPVRPVVFRGRADASGSVVEVRRRGGELLVEVDGALVERLVAEGEFSTREPGKTWGPDPGGPRYEETWEASAEALAALEEYRGASEFEPPPWDYGAELLGDGLIDVHFDLTPRGLRALAAQSG